MSYWAERQAQLESQLEEDEASLKKRLSKVYDDEFEKLTKEIAAYYTEYGEDKVIEYRQLMELLSEADRRMLLERMEDFAKKYPEYADLLPVRESIYRLNRLEGLQVSILMQQYEMGMITNDMLQTHLERLASLSALTASNAVAGLGSNFTIYNRSMAKMFVDVPWANGENFSQRIWGNAQKLAEYLCTDLAQGFARGDSYSKLVSGLRQRFANVSRRDAYRLIYTEGTYVMNQATKSVVEKDFDYYRISTVGDDKVCETCRALAKETFQFADATPGENYPPIHAWCRCSFEVVVDDWDRWMDDYVAKRQAKAAEAEKIKERFEQ